jgi:hypothetical protein
MMGLNKNLVGHYEPMLEYTQWSAMLVEKQTLLINRFWMGPVLGYVTFYKIRCFLSQLDQAKFISLSQKG